MKGTEKIQANIHPLARRHREPSAAIYSMDCFLRKLSDSSHDERNRMTARCLKSTAKDSRSIVKLVFEEALYALPSALADGQMRARTSSRAQRDDLIFTRTTFLNQTINETQQHENITRTHPRAPAVLPPLYAGREGRGQLADLGVSPKK